jgi:hypothetical protein
VLFRLLGFYLIYNQGNNMVKDKDFDEPLRDFKLRVARVYAHNIWQPNVKFHIETPERHCYTQINSYATLALLYSFLGRGFECGEDSPQVTAESEARALAKVTGTRTVREMIDVHASVYAANKDLGFPRSHAFQFHRWYKANAIVDNNGQVYIKSGKVIEGWKR